MLVHPPSVPDTVSILRGLKERYELHHGVRIRDEALVAAATLSDRYITGRSVSQSVSQSDNGNLTMSFLVLVSLSHTNDT